MDEEEHEMKEWPLAKHNRSRSKYAEATFGEIVEKAVQHGLYPVISQALEQSSIENGNYEAIEARISKLLDDIVEDSDDQSIITIREIVLVGSCLQFLQTNCTAEAWHHLWSLRWYSSILTEGLTEAVVWLAKNDAAFKQNFSKLAKQVIADAIAEPSKRSAPFERERFASMRSGWLEKPSLSSLFRGLPEADGMSFYDDEGIFRVMSETSPDTLLELILMFDNPYPVQKALEVACFDSSVWEKLLLRAPYAFTDDGAWNQSAVLPLLLSVAASHIEQAKHQMYNPKLADAENEIVELCNDVVQALALRKDSPGAIKRWSTWLMREIIIELSNHEPPMPTDARSPGYVQAILITSMDTLQSAWHGALANDVAPWEHWCYRCVLALIAQQGGSAFPDATEFADQWRLKLEDWSQVKGKQLRERAALFVGYPPRPDAYGIRMLAISLALSENPDELFQQLWETTWAIRELIEFGDAEFSKAGTNEGLPTPSAMIRLLFGLGLMMLDQVVDARLSIPGNRSLILNKLFSTLKDIADDLFVVDTFHTDYWVTALKHLAIRRLLWSMPSNERSTTFDKSTRPNLADFVFVLGGDVEHVLGLLTFLIRNSSDHEPIRVAISNNQVFAQVGLARRLIALNRKRTKLTQKDLEVITKTLLDDSCVDAQ